MSSAFKTEIYSLEPIGFGEGPHWDAKDQTLYYVDCFPKTIGQIQGHGKNKIQTSFKTNVDVDYISFATPVATETGEPPHEFIVSAYNELGFGNKNSEDFKSLWSVDKVHHHFHDGQCDSRGRLWVGKWTHNPGKELGFDFCQKLKATLCSVEKGVHKEHTAGYTATNGLCFSPSEDMVYIVDCFEHRIIGQKYDINSGEPDTEQKAVFELDHEKLGYDKKSILDGMVTDIKGNLWVVVYMTGTVINIDIETGKIINEIKLDPPFTTSLCFGGPNLSEMFVTTCTIPLKDWSDHVEPGPLGGHTFRVICEKDNSFKGTQMYPYIK